MALKVSKMSWQIEPLLSTLSSYSGGITRNGLASPGNKENVPPRAQSFCARVPDAAPAREGRASLPEGADCCSPEVVVDGTGESELS